jgi:hypothetical protein
LEARGWRGVWREVAPAVPSPDFTVWVVSALCCFWASAAASLSGFPEVSTPLGRAAMTAMVARGGGNVHNAWGAPGDPAWRHNDPSHDVERLRGTALYLASAPGNPGPDDSAGPGSTTLAIGAPTELAADLGTHHMAAALEAARQADIDIRLADWELIRRRLCLPGYVDPEQVVFDADGIFGPSGTRAFQLSGGGCMAI